MALFQHDEEHLTDAEIRTEKYRKIKNLG
jgi:hypothetical protein